MLNLPVSNAPLWRLSWRRLRRRPFQYVLFVLGVAIGVAMMVSIDLANGSARRAFSLSTDAVAGKATHRVVGGPAGLEEDVYRRIRVEAGFSPAAPVVEGYVGAVALGDQPFRLIGIDPFAEPPFRDYFAPPGSDATLDPSSLTAFLTMPGSIILSSDTAAAAGVALGDEIALDVSARPVTARVVGLLQPDDAVSRRALQNVLFTDIASAQEMFNMTGRLSYIDLIVAGASDDDEAALAPVNAVLPPDASIQTAAARGNAVQQMTAAFELNLSALSLLALIVGMFLIYNTVTFSVVQRRPLFGVLRCLGVTGGQLFALILGETLILGLIGSVLGLGLGIWLGRGAVNLITQTINDMWFAVNVRDVTISTTSLARGLVAGVGASLFAAFIPALEASRTAPQSTLRRSSLESRTRRLLPWMILAWAALTAVGIGLLRLNMGLVITFAGLFTVLLATALLAPAVTVALMKLVAPLSGRLAGAIGRLAPRDIVRSLSRTSVAIAALMMAVTAIIGVSIMVSSFRGTVVQWLDQTLQADIYVSPPRTASGLTPGGLDDETVARLRSWPGVARAVTSHTVDMALPGSGRLVRIVSVDGDISRGNRPYAWIRDDLGRNPWPALEAGEGVIISEALVRKEDLPIPPPPVELSTAEGPRALPVLAVFYDYSTDQGSIFIDNDLYRELWHDDSVSALGLFVEPGRPIDELLAEMQAAYAGRPGLLIQSNEGLRSSSMETFDRAFAITSSLRLLAVIVAFIGVLSALMSLQLERGRELGTLRATGMTRPQLWSLTLLETGLMGAVAGLLAMPVGYMLAWILIYVINVRSFGWTLQMGLQPEHFLQAPAVAISAALLAGIYPSIRAGKMEIASALREE